MPKVKYEATNKDFDAFLKSRIDEEEYRLQVRYGEYDLRRYVCVRSVRKGFFGRGKLGDVVAKFGLKFPRNATGDLPTINVIQWRVYSLEFLPVIEKIAKEYEELFADMNTEIELLVMCEKVGKDEWRCIDEI